MLRSTFSSLREYLTPISHDSNFQKTGQLTPEEFVKAGDYLVYKFPTWSWSAASPGKRRDFLPEDKQYLVTKHVPCLARASSGDGGIELIKGGQSMDDEWIVNRVVKQEDTPHAEAVVDVEDLDAMGNEEKDAETAMDIEDLDAMGIEEDELSSGNHNNTGNAIMRDQTEVQAARSYNIYITYSTSYRVPKAYLSGYDADGGPLPPKAMFDDIVGDYKDKTVTIESAPFQSNLTLISIHPCRHAGVMRMLLDMADAKVLAESRDDGDEWEEVPHGLSVDQYLVIFLKFIASVTPTIEYDFTMSAL